MRGTSCELAFRKIKQSAAIRMSGLQVAISSFSVSCELEFNIQNVGVEN